MIWAIGIVLRSKSSKESPTTNHPGIKVKSLRGTLQKTADLTNG